MINITIDSSLKDAVKEPISSYFKNDHIEKSFDQFFETDDLIITGNDEIEKRTNGWNIFLLKKDAIEEVKFKSINTVMLLEDDTQNIFKTIELLNDQNDLPFLKEIIGFKNNLERMMRAGNSYLNRIQKRIMLNDINHEKLDFEILEFLEIQKSVLQISNELSLYEEEGEFIQFVVKSVKNFKLIRDIKILKIEEINHFKLNPSLEKIIPYPDSKDSVLLVQFYSNFDQDRASFLLSNLFFELENFQFQKDRIYDVQTVNELWKDAFLSLPSPTSLFTQKGELLLHNTLFTNLKLLPKDCLNLKNGEKVDLDKVIYSVFKKEIEFADSLFSLFVFSSVGDHKDRSHISSEELGIISSSIAHELNNPIAGILASISLLELEDFFDEEIILTINDMKKSARRCQELIKVFLGFSKATPTRNIDLSMFSSFRHALELLRYRMIESNLRLEVEETSKEEAFFLGVGNSSIRAMIFYLILNEILTLYSHNNLISGEVKNCIRGKFNEQKELIIIEFTINLEKATNIHSSKLIGHLLNLENLELEMRGNDLTLKANTERLLL